MEDQMSSLLLAAAAAATLAPAVDVCDNKPVLMVVDGLTHDRARMQTYAKAIADSQIYQKLGGYYLNMFRASEVFEGSLAPNHSTLIVRFPCAANARAFWHSKVYQETIKPLRLNPSAGDYTVNLYPEIPVRDDMKGKVGDNRYRKTFDARGIERVKP
jgi:uncharacterized protein (DUF1330 family)